jgi:hypothetical protein
MIKKKKAGFVRTPKNAFPQTNKPTEQIIFFKSSVVLTHPWHVEKKNHIKEVESSDPFHP